jgi:SMODS domain-containing protein
MSGGGGGSYFPADRPALQRRIREAKEQAEKQRLDADVNELIVDHLMICNQRDPKKIQEYLESIRTVLDKDCAIEQFLFGGSVAKHTDVDGLSDVDALVILDNTDLAGRSAQDLVTAFHRSLQDGLTREDVSSVERGTLAVTVTYKDGTEIQLLPALRIGDRVAIPSPSQNGWNNINPKIFQRALTGANQRMNNLLVPTIKLIKSILRGLPRESRLIPYHIESLAIEAVKGYRGPKSAKDLLLHVLQASAKRVLRPIEDLTGQSTVIDSNLGSANSPKRRNVSTAISKVLRRLNSATSAEEWRKILEGE